MVWCNIFCIKKTPPFSNKTILFHSWTRWIKKKIRCIYTNTLKKCFCMAPSILWFLLPAVANFVHQSRIHNYVCARERAHMRRTPTLLISTNSLASYHSCLSYILPALFGWLSNCHAGIGYFPKHNRNSSTTSTHTTYIYTYSHLVSS